MFSVYTPVISFPSPFLLLCFYYYNIFTLWCSEAFIISVLLTESPYIPGCNLYDISCTKIMLRLIYNPFSDLKPIWFFSWGSWVGKVWHERVISPYHNSQREGLGALISGSLPERETRLCLCIVAVGSLTQPISLAARLAPDVKQPARPRLKFLLGCASKTRI